MFIKDRNIIKMIRIATLPGLLAGLIAACGGEQGGRGGFAMPPTAVETATAETRTVSDRFEAVGTLEAVESITVVSEIDGAILSLPFQEGAAITRGGLIAQLDTTQLAAEVRRAEALRDQNLASYQRIKAVVDQAAAAPQDLDDAAAALKVADANLALARARFAKTRIIAPFNGILGARRVSPGAFLRAGQEITVLAKVDELRVIFSAPERYLGQLKRGAEVAVSTIAFPGKTLSGQIEVIEPVLDEVTRSAKIFARVKNSGGDFRPGMSANISTVLSERDNALTIPNEAVFVNGDQSFVFVVKEDSTVARVALNLGTRLSDVVEVLSGLAPGDRVVRAGHQKLYQGAKVMPVVSREVEGVKSE